MTYAYATRTWALEKLSQYVFGRDTIAVAIDAPPRTVSTWYRQMIRRSPLTIKTPREDPRALGIVMLELYPRNIEEIASLVLTQPRTLLEWRQMNNNPRYQSDLFVRTRQLVAHYRKIMPEYVAIGDKGSLILTQGQLPSPDPVYEEIWSEYDENLKDFIEVQKLINVSQYLDRIDPHTRMPKRLSQVLSDLKNSRWRMVGPHANRGLSLNTEIHENLQNETKKQRVIGRFNQEHENYLSLPPDTFTI